MRKCQINGDLSKLFSRLPWFSEIYIKKPSKTIFFNMPLNRAFKPYRAAYLKNLGIFWVYSNSNSKGPFIIYGWGGLVRMWGGGCIQNFRQLEGKS